MHYCKFEHDDIAVHFIIRRTSHFLPRNLHYCKFILHDTVPVKLLKIQTLLFCGSCTCTGHLNISARCVSGLFPQKVAVPRVQVTQHSSCHTCATAKRNSVTFGTFPIYLYIHTYIYTNQSIRQIFLPVSSASSEKFVGL